LAKIDWACAELPPQAPSENVNRITLTF
jgi:hypothetical protein